MNFDALLRSLRRPDAYPHPVEGDVEVHQTHISAVFLAGAWAYKVKKPADLDFLDFTTPERRLHFCREEVRLNRRLAPGVYRGVVPVTASDGEARIGGEGEVVEYAVKMERLPEEATLLALLRRNELDVEDLRAVARRIADFHQRAESGEQVARWGRFEVVAENARENFEQSRDQAGDTVDHRVFRRLRELTESSLEELRPLVERRAETGVPRDTHGDLHLEHVYRFPEREPPRDVVAIDCIEFNERFRYADPVSDIGFLVMDLAARGRRDLARRLADLYFAATADPEGRLLLPFYEAYRAAVRGKVEGIAAAEPEIPGEEREVARRRARAHWLLALGALEEPERRPCLVLVMGLPGTGKSTVARGLAAEADLDVVSSDRTRKRLAGVPPDASAAAAFGEGIYTPEWTERTYGSCMERVSDLLFRGGRVAVDATFRSERRRRAFIDLAVESGVPVLLLRCTSGEETVRERLRSRTGGTSDADWTVYREVARRWDEPGPDTRRRLVEISTDRSVEETVAAAGRALTEVLAGSVP